MSNPLILTAALFHGEAIEVNTPSMEDTFDSQTVALEIQTTLNEQLEQMTQMMLDDASLVYPQVNSLTFVNIQPKSEKNQTLKQ